MALTPHPKAGRVRRRPEPHDPNNSSKASGHPLAPNCPKSHNCKHISSKRNLQLDRARTYFVVKCEWLDLGQELSRFRLKLGRRVVWTGESLNGFNGIKQVDYDKFDLVGYIPAQDVPAFVPRNIFQRREKLLFQMILIWISIFTCCPPSPVTCNHHQPP